MNTLAHEALQEAQADERRHENLCPECGRDLAVLRRWAENARNEVLTGELSGAGG